MKMYEDSKPSTEVNKSAQNPNGQRHSMKDAPVRAVDPPNQDMHSSKNLAVSPTSNIGSSRLDKD